MCNSKSVCIYDQVCKRVSHDNKAKDEDSVKITQLGRDPSCHNPLHPRPYNIYNQPQNHAYTQSYALRFIDNLSPDLVVVIEGT